MLKTLLLTLGLIGMLSAASVRAELVSTDWTSTGDALATLDTQTGLEWLDVQQTTNKSWATVSSLLDSTYQGWRLPTYQEVLTLMNTHFNHDFEQGNYQKTETYAGDFMNTFGHTLYEQTSKNLYALYTNELGQLRSLHMGRSHSTGYAVITMDNTYYNVNSVSPVLATFLVSDGGTTLSSILDPSLNSANPNAPVNQDVANVPVPAGFAGLGLLAFLLTARRRVNTVK